MTPSRRRPAVLVAVAAALALAAGPVSPVSASVAQAAPSAPAPGAAGSAVRLLRPGLDHFKRGVVLGDRLLFAGSTLGRGPQLWSTDGTGAGTVRVSDIEWSGDPGQLRQLTVFRGRVYFFADGGAGRQVLWSTDGTRGGTAPFTDLGQDPDGTTLQPMVVAGGRLFFSAWSPATGQELYATDGTAGGTRLVKDLAPGAQSSLPTGLAAFGDRVVFAAGESVSRHPWVSDGTTTGTQRLDPGVAPTSSEPMRFTAFARGLVFTWGDATTGAELWVTDGLPAHTHRVADLVPGPSGSDPELFLRYGEGVAFRATTAAGAELWASDGTAAGTRLVVDLRRGPDGSYPTPSLVLAGRLYFVASDGVHGYETWSTTGTAATTTLLADVDPGPGNGVDADGGEPQDQVDGKLVLVGSDGRTGFEPWSLGGTGGPRQIADLQPGTGSSDPAFVGTIGNSAVIAAVVDGEPSLFAWSPPVVRASSVTTATPKHRYSSRRAARRRIVVPVTVRAAGALPSGGRVTLVRRGRIVGSAPLVDGHAKVRITARLRPRHRYVVRAAWSGNATVAPSASAPIRISVSGG